MEPLLAALPLLTVVVLMVVRGWAAWKAGVVSATVAVVLAVGVFSLGAGLEGGVLSGLAGAGAEASFTAAVILWIIGPALAIHHLQVATGATGVLRTALGRLSQDPRVLALLIGWFFALFAEGAAGFGASVALAAPFLVGVGFPPLRAVTVALVGHAVGVSFGAIGTPVIPQVAATGLAPVELSAANALYHVALGWVLLAIMVRLAAPGERLTGRILWLSAVAGAAFLGPYWLIARFVGPELPTLGGALLGGAVFVAVLRAIGTEPGSAADVPVTEEPVRPYEYRRAGSDQLVGVAAADHAELTVAQAERSGDAADLSAAQAAAPYLVLVALVVVTRLVPPVRDGLGAVELGWALPGGFSGSFQPLTNPGTLLAVSFGGGAVLQRVRPDAVRRALAITGRQLVPVAGALVAMLVLARTMVNGGMTAELAESAAGVVGSGWPFIAPAVGTLGTFVTGSATASNVLFADLQAQTATALDLDIALTMGAQGFGAAVGNLVCPHNLVAASATVGLTGQEADLLRRTLPVALGYAALGGVLALVLT